METHRTGLVPGRAHLPSELKPDDVPFLGRVEGRLGCVVLGPAVHGGTQRLAQQVGARAMEKYDGVQDATVVQIELQAPVVANHLHPAAFHPFQGDRPTSGCLHTEVSTCQHSGRGKEPACQLDSHGCLLHGELHCSLKQIRDGGCTLRCLRACH